VYSVTPKSPIDPSTVSPPVSAATTSAENELARGGGVPIGSPCVGAAEEAELAAGRTEVWRAGLKSGECPRGERRNIAVYLAAVGCGICDLIWR
jgi:hypothetical protein